MPYYLSPISLKVGLTFKISGTELQHIKANRKLALGTALSIQDPQSQRFTSTITGISRNEVTLIVNQALAPPFIADRKIWLYLALIKEKALGFVLQKATELNVQGIVLFKSCYSQNPPFSSAQEKKTARWQKIIQEAAKQSGRNTLPKLIIKKDLADALNFATERQQSIFMLDKTGSAMDFAKLKQQQTQALFIGPEGGFTSTELALTKGKHLKIGQLTLRAETAAIVALSLFKLA